MLEARLEQANILKKVIPPLSSSRAPGHFCLPADENLARELSAQSD